MANDWISPDAVRGSLRKILEEVEEKASYSNEARITARILKSQVEKSVEDDLKFSDALVKGLEAINTETNVISRLNDDLIEGVAKDLFEPS